MKGMIIGVIIKKVAADAKAAEENPPVLPDTTNDNT